MAQLVDRAEAPYGMVAVLGECEDCELNPSRISYELGCMQAKCMSHERDDGARGAIMVTGWAYKHGGD